MAGNNKYASLIGQMVKVRFYENDIENKNAFADNLVIRRIHVNDDFIELYLDAGINFKPFVFKLTQKEFDNFSNGQPSIIKQIYEITALLKDETI